MLEKGKGGLKSEEEERSLKNAQLDSYLKNIEPKFQ
jgi:hypothetical protein